MKQEMHDKLELLAEMTGAPLNPKKTETCRNDRKCADQVCVCVCVCDSLLYHFSVSRFCWPYYTIRTPHTYVAV